MRLPLSIRDIKPHPDAIRLAGVRKDGLPDGIHTGGCYLWQGEVWKPLDGRPYVNCDCHVTTLEAECLQAMEGRPLFPKNWRKELRNGREWIVRQEAYPVDNLSKNEMLEVEQAILTLNERGWEVGDAITLMRDRQTYELFVVDLSCATYRGNATGICAADDSDRIHRLFKEFGYDFIANTRKVARWLLSDARLFNDLVTDNHAHVYCSFSRPLSPLWARIPGNPVYVSFYDIKSSEFFGSEIPDDVFPNRTDGYPHTWVITTEPLSYDLQRSYELAWGWSYIKG